MTDKQSIRGETIKRRDEINAEYSEKAAITIAEKIMSLWADYKSYALYCAIKSELSLYPLMNKLWDAGKSVLLPKVTDGYINLHYCASMAELKVGYMNIYEPSGGATAERVDFIAVPGVAFDRKGYRVGYGKGFYDRLLSGLSRKLTVGIAFDIQISTSVPHEEHDVAMDAVLTEKGLIAGNGMI
ncbi:MAG: 5-formyltetrahydrofolate cyclo-ligase [Deferribacteraceae bacterium]|jgi:5-formyltetrahydrofolate cyclo-ligase|nr:5-formyltetrahydrofolate cyclo-ligase [Deferribacteraceae bacterium]